MDGEDWEHSTASFVVRLRRSPTPEGETEERGWLVRIEHVQTGQRAAVHGLQDVVAFMVSCLANTKVHAALMLAVALVLSASGLTFRGWLDL